MDPPIVISVDPKLKHVGLFIYYGLAKDVVVEKGRVDVREHARKVVNEVINTYVLERVKELPIIKCYRSVMWRLGIDPTKVRLSSEALLRRVLRGRTFPHINNVVDTCNIASLETLIPISVFDLRKVREKELKLRRSMPNELFIGSDDSIEVLSGNEVVLSSDNDILYLYPHKNSKIALIDVSTKEVLVIAYGVQEVPKILIRDAVEKTLKYLTMYCNARILMASNYVD